MVWSRETDAERPPLSVILPRLYLGAERDVTQERLASLGISYVLSVSRCSPQPSFLPRSRYLRIPIDDSLWDDLLPWIPQALHFIDAAMSSGASVLVHCAAGISRSPALAVAYIMYSLGMDLDQAYRFVKERRPSISPNFNFLGQLQHFQGTLNGGPLLQQPAADRADHARSVDEINREADDLSGGEDGPSLTDRTQQRLSEGSQQPSPSGKLRNFHLTLSLKQVHTPREASASAPSPPHHQPATKPPPNKSTELQLPPPGSASLLEKRKSLTLSLTPLGVSPPVSAGPVHGGGEAEQRSEAEAKAHRGPGPHGEQGPPSRCSRAEAQEHGLLSPFSFTLNKLLGWGERLLLGGMFVHPVRMGQPALPYRC